VIAVHVNESRHCAERIKLATELAIRYDAHLIGVSAIGLRNAVYVTGMEGSAEVLADYLDELNDQAKAVLGKFETIAEGAGVNSFEKQLIEDESGAALCLQARCSDLVIIGQDDPNEPSLRQRENMPAYVVMNSGRPVLIVPSSGQFSTIGSRVVVAWDAGLAATRAITFSMPFLKRAEQVQVLVFDSPAGQRRTHDELPGADIAAYLARHDVKVEVSRKPASDDIGIGNSLLSRIADFDADLLVMGCYGHSRFREILLGG
jgi:nucleotide-binding universal stress UspA family protein